MDKSQSWLMNDWVPRHILTFPTYPCVCTTQHKNRQNDVMAEAMTPSKTRGRPRKTIQETSPVWFFMAVMVKCLWPFLTFSLSEWIHLKIQSLRVQSSFFIYVYYCLYVCLFCLSLLCFCVRPVGRHWICKLGVLQTSAEAGQVAKSPKMW